MITKAKNRLIFVVSFILILLAIAYWYKLTYAMEVVENRVVNNPQFTTKILIATQGSDFKNAIVTNIINFYKKDSVYLKTIDVSRLEQIIPAEYKAIVILHTWEYGKPPRAVTKFINENEYLKHKMIAYATSGAGNNMIEGIDALAGESILENASDVSDEIIEKIAQIVN